MGTFADYAGMPHVTAFGRRVGACHLTARRCRCAEVNAIVLLLPCLGGAVDAGTYPHAPDVSAGKLDSYGQLDADYVHQSAPHMRAIMAEARGTMTRDRKLPARASQCAATPLPLSVDPRAATAPIVEFLSITK